MRLRSAAFPLLLAFAVFASVLAGHFWLITTASSPVPLHDQWQAEAEFIYLPAIENHLGLADFFRPHSEHRIAPTRLLAFALFELNHRRWDVRLQMTANAFLCAGFMVVLLRIGARSLARGALVAFAAIFSALLASPLFYGNALWGFQSQFYFLLLFSCLHLLLVTTRRVGSGGWIGGVFCSLAACISMGSGSFSAVVVAVYQGALWCTGRCSRERRGEGISFFVHVAIVLIAVIRAPSIPHSPPHWANCVETFLHCLAWPQPYFISWGFWVWLPFAIFISTAFRRLREARVQLILSLGLWVLAQIAAISLARNEPAIVITPRYYEIFFLGLVANTLALIEIRRTCSPPRIRLVYHLAALVWCLGTGYYAIHFEESHRRLDLSTYRTLARSQVDHVRQYIDNHSISTLRNLAYPSVPHPDPDYLAKMLDDPRVREILPAELNDIPSPRLGRAATRLRATAPLWGATGIFAFIAAFFLRRTSPIPDSGELSSQSPKPPAAIAKCLARAPEDTPPGRVAEPFRDASVLKNPPLDHDPASARDRAFFVLVAFVVGAFVLGARWGLIAQSGNPVPYHDQWFAEPPSFFLTTWSEKIAWAFSPHNDHRIIPTKILSYGLLKGNGFWDVRLQMVVNAFIASAVLFPLLALIRPFVSQLILVLVGAALAWFCSLSILYENALWGFQSQFYFLILFSLCHLRLMIGRRPLSLAWWCGAGCGVLAVISMGSGVLAPLAVSLAVGWRWFHASDRDTRDVLNFSCAVAIATFGFWALPHSPAPGPAFHWAVSWHTFRHALSFPQRECSFIGFLLWIPFLVLTARATVRRGASSADLILLGTGLWVLLQIAAMAYERPITGPVLPNRYYDILVVGLVVNLAALASVWFHARPEFRSAPCTVWFGAFALLWVATVSWHARMTHRVNHENLEPVFRVWRDEQIQRLNHFIRTRDASVLRDATPGQLPVPDPSILENLLVRPEFCRYLSFELHPKINLQFPVQPGIPSLDNALPNTVPNDPGLLHRGTFGKLHGAAAVFDTISAPATKQADTRLMFKIAGDLKSGETEIRIHDHSGRVTAVITDLHAEQLTPVFVDVADTVFSVEVFDHSPTRWLAFIEPVEVGPWSFRALQAIGWSRRIQWLAAMGCAVLLTATVVQSLAGRPARLDRA